MDTGIHGVQVLTAAVQCHALSVALHRLVVTGIVLVLLVAGLSGVLMDVRNNWVAHITSSWNQSIGVHGVGQMNGVCRFWCHGCHSTRLLKVLV